MTLAPDIDTPIRSRGRQRGLEPQRRFVDHAPLRPEMVTGISASHPAAIVGRSIFQRSVVDVDESPRLLISGHNSPKLGDRVSKGAWKGFPIFQLTLEERATCSSDCHNWLTCFGNASPFSRRHRHGPELVARLQIELAEKQAKHPRGFVVRPHILGDFYSVEYVAMWGLWLSMFPALRVFGYSQRKAGTEIGDAVIALRNDRWDRFAVRTSSETPGRTTAVTIDRIPNGPRVAEGIVCPAQLDESGQRCCGNCCLCWSAIAKHESIVFVLHGEMGRRPA